MTAVSAPDFARDVAPIFQKNCLGCHSSTAHKGRLVLDSYDSLMKGGRHGQVIVARDADASRLVQMLEGTLDPQMPLESDPLRRSRHCRDPVVDQCRCARPSTGTLSAAIAKPIASFDLPAGAGRLSRVIGEILP